MGPHPSPGKTGKDGNRPETGQAQRPEREEDLHGHSTLKDTCSAGESQCPARPSVVNRGAPSGSQAHLVAPNGASSTGCSHPEWGPPEAAGQPGCSVRGGASRLPRLRAPPRVSTASAACRLPHVEPHSSCSISLLLRNVSCFIMTSFSCSGSQAVWVLKGLALALSFPSARLHPGPYAVSCLKGPHKGPTHDFKKRQNHPN